MKLSETIAYWPRTTTLPWQTLANVAAHPWWRSALSG